MITTIYKEGDILAENIEIQEEEKKESEDFEIQEEEEKASEESEVDEDVAQDTEADSETDEAKEAESEEEEADADTEAEGEEESEESGEGDEAEGDSNEEKESDEKGKKDPRLNRFFKKKAPKDKRNEKIEELTDRLKRQMAEFENFRKRSDKEKAQMYDMGAKSMIERILPVADSFERGLGGLPEEDDNPFADGMKMVYKQLLTALSEAGVKEIEAVGQTFDPNLHNAVMHIDDDSYGENEIVEELQKGYTYHDSVVRYAMVKVAN